MIHTPVEEGSLTLWGEAMEVTVHIPDDLASRMTEAGGDLARRALEGLALEEFKTGHH